MYVEVASREYRNYRLEDRYAYACKQWLTLSLTRNRRNNYNDSPADGTCGIGRTPLVTREQQSTMYTHTHNDTYRKSNNKKKKKYTCNVKYIYNAKAHRNEKAKIKTK